MTLEVLQSDNTVLKTFQVVSTNVTKLVDLEGVFIKKTSIQIIKQDDNDFFTILSGQKIVLKDNDVIIKEFVVEPQKFVISYDLIQDNKVLTIKETQTL